jgi:hypothetical protein
VRLLLKTGSYQVARGTPVGRGGGGGGAWDLVAVLGKRLEWVADDGQADGGSPEIRAAPGLVAGDRAIGLVCGRVIWPLGDGTHAEGVVLSHDGDEDLYEVQLTEGGWEVATLSQLLSYWDTHHTEASPCVVGGPQGDAGDGCRED